MKLLRGFCINLQFLTIIPIRWQLPMDKEHLKRSIQTFPLLGLFQGACYAAILYGLIHWTPFTTEAIAVIFMLSTILFTGGMHLDGWIDTSDAFFSYREKEKRLEIMVDPRVGAFGIISMIVLLSSRLLFFYEITRFVQPFTYILVVIVPILSKSLIGVFLLQIQAAKASGLGHLFQQAVKKESLRVYYFYFVALSVCLYLIDVTLLVYCLLLYGGTLLFALFFSRKIVQWFGGITGDILGASVEGVEWLLWMIIWLLHYYVMG